MGEQNIYNTKTNHCKYLFLRIKTQYERKINQNNGLTKQNSHKTKKYSLQMVW